MELGPPLTSPFLWEDSSQYSEGLYLLGLAYYFGYGTDEARCYPDLPSSTRSCCMPCRMRCRPLRHSPRPPHSVTQRRPKHITHHGLRAACTCRERRTHLSRVPSCAGHLHVGHALPTWVDPPCMGIRPSHFPSKSTRRCRYGCKQDASMGKRLVAQAAAKGCSRALETIELGGFDP